ncbi:BppU family phage baseplate upper protein [Staphylococcus equorum]|uniref:BppU family phage baseplate upper protein n=1 Tax=Staphylococcus equorum TaxID=246432 RepID=UPI002553DC84|nr:BppU family phage baseplate upper protein [Staphylococcus equorum]MDK9843594.1 BppU family phage baseplate upper protein [Staphylococcus equorum]
MRIYKNKDITTSIDTEKMSINNSDTYFYTEDKGSAALRIFINHRKTAFNLDNTNLTPVLDLFHTDGSIWLDEPLEVIMSDKGILQYNIPNNVISHAGRIKAKLFLRNAEQSVHVANFTFDIRDSGIEGAIEKEISVNLVDDAVRRIVKENATELLDDEYKEKINKDVVSYIASNPDKYKGSKGDTGLQGPQGEQGDSGDKINYIKVDKENDFTAFLKIADNEYSASRFFKDTSDEFLKGYDNYIQKITTEIGEKTIKENYSNVSNGSMTSTVGNNHYTTVVGTEITYVFNGSYIDFSALCNTSGGLWRATVDGQVMGDYSVYSETPITKVMTIADDLENKEHTLKLEFVGEDPENPIESPRGWLRFDDDNINTTFTVKYNDVIENEEKIVDFTVPFSNKEFAFNVRDKERTKSTEWFPAHNNIITTLKGENFTRLLLLDGNEVDITKSSEKLFFKKAKFIQKVANQLTSDTEPRAETTFIVTFEDGKVYNEVKIKWLQDSEITSGYFLQMPFRASYLDKLVTDKFEEVNKDIVNTGQSSQLTNLDTNIFIGLSDDSVAKNYIYKGVILEKAEPFKYIKLSHRNETIQKLYLQPYLYTSKTQGTIDYFKGYYEYAKVKNANNIYKL